MILWAYGMTMALTRGSGNGGPPRRMLRFREPRVKGGP
jgi:hypothetical protein